MRADTPISPAGASIGRAWRELTRGRGLHALRRHLYGPLVEAAQTDALDVLATVGPVRMSELAHLLGVDPSTATRTVIRLEHGDYAERVSAADDARSVVVEMTPNGRATIAEVMRRRDDLLRGSLEGFDADELAQFAELLERFVAGVGAYGAQATREPNEANHQEPGRASESMG